MDESRTLNWVMAYVLRWTVGAALFGAALELILSRTSHAAFRPEVPVCLAFGIFALALSGGVVALYLSWLIDRHRSGQ
ncbi:MAG: hypothetical protein SFU83_13290 [Meiothermus sp.]|nr:hypothetical protein [Meiothermus sp.]